MVNENNKKKVIIGTTVAIVFLIVLVISATYAFYTLNVTDSETNTNINIETGSANVVSIEQGVGNIHINLSVSDMASNSLNKEYYATDKTEENYKTNQSDGTLELAKVTMSSKGEETENCTATMTITMETKEGSMGRELKKGDSELYIEVGGNTQTIDLSELLTEPLQEEVTKDIELELSVTSKTPTSIKGYLKINNTDGDQTYLAGKTLNLTIEVKDLKCGVVKTAEEVILASKQLEAEQQMKDREDTLRRFQGQVTTSGATINNDVNNYICFETSDAETCKKDTGKYLYRIIGIDTTNKEIKIMKREALDTSQTWGSGSPTWANSSLQTSLNGTLYLNNVSKSWEALIQPHDWYYGDVPNNDNSGVGSYGPSNNIEGQQLYKNEKAKWENNKITGTKIGLIYISDYYLSAQNIKCFNSSSVYEECKKSWMHLSNNDTSSLSTTHAAPPSKHEWTMSRCDSSRAWYVYGAGNVSGDYFSYTYSVRPVFYLSSEIKIIDGDGSRDNPYIIKDPNLLTAEEKILLSPQLEDEQQMKDRGDTLRRFQGQVTTSGATINNDVNNYICFGTGVKATCTGNTDKYLYRIIGTDTSNKEIEVMKREALNTDQTWTSSSQNWGSSTLQQALNSTLYLNTLDSSWSDLIIAHDWGYGDVPANISGFTSSTTSIQAYQNEQTAITSGNNHGTLNDTKIGLIYASDYYLSGGESLMCQHSSSSYADCKKSWMHLSNNDTKDLSTTKQDPPDTFEWTMSRNGGGVVWYVNSDGYVHAVGVSGTYSVRPVFYISTNNLKLSGAGSLSNPFVIQDVEE